MARRSLLDLEKTRRTPHIPGPIAARESGQEQQNDGIKKAYWIVSSIKFIKSYQKDGDNNCLETSLLKEVKS
ncbi:hypothetical protein E2C01_063053 [Portunus trituberculatus]|uniref:Uncharacterized protein n=1 Tax=Portunus trituberculatus TaxID=210409 RepID=A0A5B7HFC5_PORTR|nr:hypothetical protein [Portunus trituberculatus]